MQTMTNHTVQSKKVRLALFMFTFTHAATSCKMFFHFFDRFEMFRSSCVSIQRGGSTEFQGHAAANK